MFLNNIKRVVWQPYSLIIAASVGNSTGRYMNMTIAGEGKANVIASQQRPSGFVSGKCADPE